MQSTPHLYDLIKSLDRNEKRYFKVFVNQHVKGEKNTYLKIFEEVEKQKKFDDNYLKEVFKNESFTNNFHVVKRYLYDLILKCLRNYYNDFTVNAQLLDMLRNIEILDNKGLTQQCVEEIKKAKKLAVQYENYALMHNILNREEQISKNPRTQTNLTIKEIKATHHEIDTNLSRLGFINKIQYIQNQMFFFKHGDYIDPDIVRLINENLIVSKNIPNGTLVQLKFYISLSNYYWNLKNDIGLATHASEKAYNIIKNNFYLIKDNPGDFTSIIFRLIALYGESRNRKKVREYLQIAKSIPVLLNKRIAPFFVPRISFITKQLEITDSIQYKEHNKTLKLLTEMQSIVNKYNKKLSAFNMIFFQFMSMCIYFNNRKYNDALNHVNAILDSNYSRAGNFKNFAHLLSLIVHFELGNNELITYRLRTTYNYFKKKDKLFRLEKLLLNFIKSKLLKAMSKKQLKNAFELLEIEIHRIMKNPNNYDDMMEWIDFDTWLNHIVLKT